MYEYEYSTDQDTDVDLLVLALDFILVDFRKSIHDFCCAYFHFRRLLTLTVDSFIFVLLEHITLLLVLV